MGFAILLLLLPLLALAAPARAQYNPIPNYSGANAGQQFRGAVNDRFSGVQPTSPKIVSLTFANLPAEQDGFLIYCKDCQKTIPCAGSGSGAWAFGQRGAWACTAPGTLEQDLNANSHKVTNLATDTATGDALSRGQSTMNSLAVPTAGVAMNGQGFTNLNSLAAGGSNPTIAGFHGGFAGVIDPTANLNLLCTGAGAPYAFCTGALTGTYTPVVCDGVTDNTTSGQAAINAVCSSKGKLRFPIGTCLYDHWTIPACDGAIIEGSGSHTDGSNTTILRATSTTQTACTTAGTTGGFQSLDAGNLTLQHLYFDSSAGALKSSCLLSIVGVAGDTHVKLKDVAIYPATTPAAGTDPIDIYSSHLTHFQWDDVTLGGHASYLWYMGAYSNGGQVNNMLLAGRPIYDIGNPAIVAVGNGVNFVGLDSENQLNAILDNAAASLVNFKYAGDPPINCGVWLPGMTMTAPADWTAKTTTASCVQPVLTAAANAVITGNTHSSTTIDGINATVTTSWVGRPIHIVGGGPAGADLSTRIATMVSASSITIDTATSNSANGVYLSIPAYAGHVYMASTAGTASTATVPAFPTSAGGTVTDNTGVWTEIGPGAQVEADGGSAVIAASYFGGGNVYVYSPYVNSGGPALINNEMLAPNIAGAVLFSGGQIVGGASTGNNDAVLYWLGDGTHNVDFDFGLGNVVTGVINANATDIAYMAPASRGVFKFNGVWTNGHVADDSGNGSASLWSYSWSGVVIPASIRGAWAYVTGSGASATTALLNDINNHQVVSARNAANSADVPLVGTDSSNNVVVGGTNAAGISLKNNVSATGTVTTSNGASTSWTPSDQSGGSLTFTSVSTHYQQVAAPGMVCVYGTFTYPATADAHNATIGGLPVAVPNQAYTQYLPMTLYTSSGSIASVLGVFKQNTSTFSLFNSSTGAALTNANLSGLLMFVNGCYPTT